MVIAPESRLVPPRASSLVESMRDVGYSLDSALADIIDNSISAGAKTVRMFASASSPRRLAVVDDGRGLTEDELVEAMRLGTKHPREVRASDDLGRFGLGLKTASFSQCRRLTVASRRAGVFVAACWDLDEIEASDSWALHLIRSQADVPFSDKLQGDGTLVLWERMDRVPGAESGAANLFNEALDEARARLGLVFHRFLAPERRTDRVKLDLNGTPIEAFDPFNANHPSTQRHDIDTIPVNGMSVTITPYTLPHHRNVSPKDWERSAGPEGYLRNQGFYLYRAKRLVLHGTWFGLARQQVLTQLSRIQIDIPNGMDSLWALDIKKASARPPEIVRARLRRLVPHLEEPSRRVFTRRATQLHGNPVSIWRRAQLDGKLVYQINEESPLVADLLRAVDGEAQEAVRRGIRVIAAALPVDSLLGDLHDQHSNVTGEELDDATLEQALAVCIEALSDAGDSDVQIVNILKSMEPFRSHWDACEEMLPPNLKEL